MKQLLSTTVVFLICVCFSLSVAGQPRSAAIEIVPPKGYEPPVFKTSAELRSVLVSAIDETLAGYRAGAFPKTDIAATLIDLRNPNALVWTDVRGDERIYPASVVKMLYMTSLERQLE